MTIACRMPAVELNENSHVAAVQSYLRHCFAAAAPKFWDGLAADALDRLGHAA